MLFDNTVYQCSLYSITPNIRVNHDQSKRENIAEAEVVDVGEIMVQPTLNPNMYREIITGMLIPVYRTTTKFGLFHSFSGDKYYKAPKGPVFIKVDDTYNFGEYSNNLKVAKLEEVKKYIEQFSVDISSFRYQLNYLFESAETYYERASSKGDVSDGAKIKSLVKSIGKK